MSNTPKSRGPLHGIQVLEIESIGPGPFCAMLLADLGANVLTVRRSGATDPNADVPVLNRNRAGSVQANLKDPADRERVLQLVARADALIEGFRPGVMERLGLGPDACHAANPRLVYGRMTGWGQDGPLANRAGHDINYIALSGALHSMGTAYSGPVPPLNLVGDFGGGGLMLALGIVSAVLEARTSGHGQVIDTAMVEGAGVLMGMIFGLRAIGMWPQPRAGNFLDGSAWYYRCYPTSDGHWMAVGAVEPQFRRLFLDGLGVGDQHDEIVRCGDQDPELHRQITAIFQSRTRQEWTHIFEGTDACVSPVLAMDEVASHPHNQARGSFRTVDGVLQPQPAPRFSRTPLTVASAAAADRGPDLSDWGL